MNVADAIKELRKSEKREFVQTIDLIVNLKGVDAKKESISALISLPHPLKEKKVLGFMNTKNKLIPTIPQTEFVRFKDKKELKKLLKQYDFFIASGKLMPSVATTFGKVLGPSGKMPTPQLGVLMEESDNAIEQVLKKIKSALKIRVKEASVKVPVGKESMSDEQIIENINAVYEGFVSVLPTKKENVKSVLLKLTMSKPVAVEIK